MLVTVKVLSSYEQKCFILFENGGGKTMQTYTYVSKGKFELREKPKPVIMRESLSGTGTSGKVERDPFLTKRTVFGRSEEKPF